MFPACAGTVPPVIEIVWVPATAVTTPPTQVVLAFGVGATIMPLVGVPGRLSVMDALIRGEAFVFCKVMVNVEIPPGLTIGGVKILLIEKSVSTCTVRFAVRGFGTVRFSLLVMSVGWIVLV